VVPFDHLIGVVAHRAAQFADDLLGERFILGSNGCRQAKDFDYLSLGQIDAFRR